MSVETAQFWAEVPGWRIEEDGDDHEVELLLPPDSAEAGVVPDDRATKVARLVALGATRVDVGQGGDVMCVAMADLEGNEFCVLRRRAAAYGSPATAVG